MNAYVSEFGNTFQRKVTLFWRYPNFLVTRSVYQVEENLLDSSTPTVSTEHGIVSHTNKYWMTARVNINIPISYHIVLYLILL